MTSVPLVGGPLDGYVIDARGMGVVWLDATGAPALPNDRHALLYFRGAGELVFAGHGAWQCRGCEVYVGEARPVCPLCGELA